MGQSNPQKKKDNDKKYREAHKADAAIYQKEYRLKHGKELYLKRKSYFKEYMKKWREENKDHLSTYNRKYFLNNKVDIQLRDNKYRKNKKKTDVQYLLKVILRGRLNKAIKGIYKSGSAVKDLGCTVSELKFYIEGKFKDGMSWENYGKLGWHIDHVIPLAFFDLTNKEQFLQACHYTNLQPLWAKENIKKSNKIISIT